MTPSRPYLVRAIYEWLVDNDATPYLLIDATNPLVRVPPQHIKDGKIVLNAAPHAVKDFFIQNDGISFSARFGGVPMMISAPMVAVLAIYARENGQGMFFDSNEEFGDQTTPQDEPTVPALVATPVLTSAPAPTEKNADDSDETPRAKPTGRPSLSVVK